VVEAKLRAALGQGFEVEETRGPRDARRVAHSAADIEVLRGSHPGDAIILLCPDTVPDDISLSSEARIGTARPKSRDPEV
jgi:hypothetical protein